MRIFERPDTPARAYAAVATNNVTHAVLAATGLLAGLLPRSAQRPYEEEGRESRFARSAELRERAGRV